MYSQTWSKLRKSSILCRLLYKKQNSDYITNANGVKMQKYLVKLNNDIFAPSDGSSCLTLRNDLLARALLLRKED